MGDLEHVLRHHEEVQEEVAREMIKMAQALKQNSLAAKTIILTDNQVSIATLLPLSAQWMLRLPNKGHKLVNSRGPPLAKISYTSP